MFMKEIEAIGVSAGMSTGKAYLLAKEQINIPTNPISDIARELDRFRFALKEVKLDIRVILDSQAEKDKFKADILKTHLTLLEDPATTSDVFALIEESYNAAFAVKKALSDIADSFEALDDIYMQERAFDIHDIMNMLIMKLLGIKARDLSDIPENSVIVADNLTACETTKMNLSHVAGIITAKGGVNSHISIVARSFKIPAVISSGNMLKGIYPGDLILLDGSSGRAYIRPTAKIIEAFAGKMKEYIKAKSTMDKFALRSAITKDGRQAHVLANIGIPGEIQMLSGEVADGIGLFRSEFLFMDKSHYPSEQEQLAAYSKAADAINGKSVAIRTMDLGGDKRLDYLGIKNEDNPYLGYRAIRISLDRPEQFKVQIRAILQAGAVGNVRILLPLISSVEELLAAKLIINQVKDDLKEEKLEFDENMQIGIMIEVPSAAIMAREMAGLCDFFAIGTNDLIQYTIAADRGNSYVSALYSQYHPSVLRLVAFIINAANEAGIECCMCGEAAGDPLLVPAFLGMGLGHFSMGIGSIPHAKAIISSINYYDSKKLAEDILECLTVNDVKEKLVEYAQGIHYIK